jgi:hypothetical protein
MSSSFENRIGNLLFPSSFPPAPHVSEPAGTRGTGPDGNEDGFSTEEWKGKMEERIRSLIRLEQGSGECSGCNSVGHPLTPGSLSDRSSFPPHSTPGSDSFSPTSTSTSTSLTTLSPEKELVLLKAQVKDIARVCRAVAKGDLQAKITVPVEGPIMGELKDVINGMVDQLKTFAEEVERVATEGQFQFGRVVDGLGTRERGGIDELIYVYVHGWLIR